MISIHTEIHCVNHQGLKRLLENLLEDEITAKVKTRRYELSPQRNGYRGGHLCYGNQLGGKRAV